MLTETLARLVVETRTEALSETMLDRANAALNDTIGCAIAGSGSEVARKALSYARSVEAAPRAAIWGSEERTSPAEAAFVNGISAHALDFDDSLPSLKGHPSALLYAVGHAVAETKRISGRELLAAYVLGVEVVGKIGRALNHGHYARGWHLTATAGAFSSAAMAGRLLGLDVGQMCNAFGLAAADAGGLVRNFGFMAKSFHAGRSARAGYVSARLAADGLTADMTVLDGAGGFIDAYGDEHSTLDVPPPGRPWEILDPGIYVKRWPCCYANHRALAGMFQLMRDHSIAAGEVQEIAVGFMPEADKALVHFDPKTGLEGKFSIEYCAAAAVIDGRVALATFTDEAVARTEVRALMQKVRRFPMPGKGSFSGVIGSTDVVIRTGRGTFETRIDHTPGSPAAPMTETDRRDKFLDCVAPVFGRDRAENIRTALASMASADDAAEILGLASISVSRSGEHGTSTISAAAGR